MNAGSAHIPPEQLSSRIDDELSADVARTVDGHLAACEDCRNVVVELSEIDELVRAADVPVLPPRVWHRVAAQFDQTFALPPSRRWLAWLGVESLSLTTARALAWSAAGTLLLAAVFLQQWWVRRAEMVRLAEIDHARTVLIAQYSGTENPFRLEPGKYRDGNPFVVHPLNRDTNPFQASTAR